MLSGLRTDEVILASHAYLLRLACLVAPRNPKLVRRRSRLLRRRGDVAGALALVERGLIAAPENPRLLAEYARIVARTAKERLKVGDATDALALIERALVAAPENPRLLAENARMVARVAKERLKVGDAAGALAVIERALLAAPENPRLLAEYARMVARVAKERLKVGDAAGALGMADKAIAQAGDHPELVVLRAIALHSLACYQDALDAWRKVAQHASLEARGWVGMAKAWRALDRSEQIEALIEEYLRALGESPQRYVRAAYVAAADRRLAIFEVLLAQAREIAEKDDQSRAALAALHFHIGRAGEALNYLDGVPQLEPQLASKRKNFLRALGLVGVNVDELTPAQRADLRMPDLALQTLVNHAPSGQRSATTCQIAMVYTTLGPGGAERQLANTVRGLCALEGKHEIVLIPARDRARDIDRFHAAGLDGLPITIEPWPIGEIDLLRLQSWSGSQTAELLNLLPYWLRTQIGHLTSRFLDNPPQVVHTWGDPRSIVAGIAATLAGVPRIVLGTRTIASPTRYVPTYFHSVYRALLDRPGVVFLNNSVEGARSYAAWLGVEASRLKVIYNGVDTEALARAREPQTSAAHRARLGLPADARIVGTAFRLEQVKRPLLWVQAAAAVARREPRAHFLIVGDGPLRAQVQSLAHELGIADRLHMPGRTHEVVPWYELMDVVLLTSEREGASNTALEAQALGKPVVSPAVGGMPETFIPDVSGFLVDPDPLPDNLAEQVMRALTDDGWRRRAAAAARGFIQERFSLERMIRDTLEVYGLAESDRGSR